MQILLSWWTGWRRCILAWPRPQGLRRRAQATSESECRTSSALQLRLEREVLRTLISRGMLRAHALDLFSARFCVSRAIEADLFADSESVQSPSVSRWNGMAGDSGACRRLLATSKISGRGVGGNSCAEALVIYC